MTDQGFIWHRDGEISPKMGKHWALPHISVEENEWWLLLTCLKCKAEALVIREGVERSTAHVISHRHGGELKVLFQDAGRN